MNNQPVHLCDKCTDKKCALRKKRPEVAAHYLVKCGWYRKPVPVLDQIDIFEGVAV